jgi:hypothetical protein
MVIVAIVSTLLGFAKKDTFFLCCTNHCIMSIGPLKSATGTEQSRFKFLFYSSCGTFLASSGVLLAILWTAQGPAGEWPAGWDRLLLTGCGDPTLLGFSIIMVGALKN